jgi:hypothetical protein
MTLTRLLTAASFAAVMAASAAHAQTTTTETTVEPDGTTITQSTTTSTPVPNPDGSVGVEATTSVEMSTDATTAGVPASSLTTNYMGAPGTVTTRTVTNGPVPDTAENRAKYGQPMSNAGKRSAAAGN